MLGEADLFLIPQRMIQNQQGFRERIEPLETALQRVLIGLRSKRV